MHITNEQVKVKKLTTTTILQRVDNGKQTILGRESGELNSQICRREWIY